MIPGRVSGGSPSASSVTSLGVPQTQNTAPVLEFNCLYTHDIRRKNKRWQDGFLRFHTFNKRVMVYDVSRNFIGDTHWKSADDLQDGDEVTLESGGALVQVSESIGRTETDLTELMKKKKNNHKDGFPQHSPTIKLPSPLRRVRTCNRVSPAPMRQHRTLNSLLGMAKRPVAEAKMKDRSPFEERYGGAMNQIRDDDGPRKRQRRNQISPSCDQQENTLMQRDTPSQQSFFTSRPKPITSTLSGSSPDTQDSRYVLEDTKYVSRLESRSSRETPFANILVDDLAMKGVQRERRLAHRSMQRRSFHRTLDENMASPVLAATPLRNQKAGRTKVNTPGADESPPRPQHPSRRQQDSTFKIAAYSPQRKKLLCHDQLLSRSQTLKPGARGIYSQKQKLEERLTKMDYRNRDVMEIPDRSNEASYDSNQLNTCKIDAQFSSTPPLGRIQALNEAKALDVARLSHTMLPLSSKSAHPYLTANARVSCEGQVSCRLVSGPRKQMMTTEEPGKCTSSVPVEFKPLSREAADAAGKATLPQKQIRIPVSSVSAVSNISGPEKLANGLPHYKCLYRDVSSLVPEDSLGETRQPDRKRSGVLPLRPDPWSREAFDLFTWRPPDWDEDKWCRIDARTNNKRI